MVPAKDLIMVPTKVPIKDLRPLGLPEMLIEADTAQDIGRYWPAWGLGRPASQALQPLCRCSQGRSASCSLL